MRRSSRTRSRKRGTRARITGLPALADDSGICVDALDGAPGVYSARYADAGQPRRACGAGRAQQSETTHAARARNESQSALLLRDCVRRAAPTIRSRSSAKPMAWRSPRAPRGSGGFGYDPLFFIPALRKTAAEFRADEKNRISHRGQALAALAARLDPHAGVSIRTPQDVQRLMLRLR